MTRLWISRFLVFACALLALPQAQPKPRPKTHKAAANKASTSRSKTRGHVTRASAHSKRGHAGRYSARFAPKAASWRNRQMAPTSDRYREIQEALASKGYLKSTPTGSWDADSQDALKRFQADQKIEQTGKLNSLSLIALGLGPAKSAEPPAAPKP
jgi:hypothetical protein